LLWNKLLSDLLSRTGVLNSLLMPASVELAVRYSLFACLSQRWLYYLYEDYTVLILNEFLDAGKT
jgi:hypothetical protein